MTNTEELPRKREGTQVGVSQEEAGCKANRNGHNELAPNSGKHNTRVAYVMWHFFGLLIGAYSVPNVLTRAIQVANYGWLLKFFFSQIACITLYFLVVVSDPGILKPPRPRSETLNFLDKGPIYQVTPDREEFGAYCKVCKFIRPPRGKHCWKCGHCIGVFDHHCMITSTCIGYKNHRLFVVFSIAHFSFTSWGFWQMFIAMRAGVAEVSMLAIFLGGIATFGLFVFAVFTGLLTIGHLWLSLTNQTTLDLLKANNSKVDFYYCYSLNLKCVLKWWPFWIYDKGYRRNLWEFWTGYVDPVFCETRIDTTRDDYDFF